MGRNNHEQDTVRRYLLKDLSDAEQQHIEFRLLTDDSFANELEIAEDELIDEYLANELSRAERKSFEKNFLTNPERNRKLQSGQALKRYFDGIAPRSGSMFQRALEWVRQYIFQSPGSASIISSPVSVVLMFLIVSATGVIIWREGFYQSDLDKGLLALNKAYSQERPIEARVSRLDYAPFNVTRDGKDKPVNELELKRAQRFLFDAET